MAIKFSLETTMGNEILVLGGTGKTGRRIAKKLKAKGIPARIASRSAMPSFDWNDDSTWPAILDGISAVYLNYAPDLAVPGATDAVRNFVAQAIDAGVTRLVLLSGRGEEEAQACERIVQETDLEWTVVRASWFMQNFSEGEFTGMVLDGAITLPAADIPEPFIDINDIADVVVAALTEDGHAYETYEVTGPRLMTFTDLAREISKAAGNTVPFVQIPANVFATAIEESGAPEEIAWLLNYLFETVLDGRNAYLGDGVQRALGREPTDFSAFAHRVAERGVWTAHAEGRVA
jgi:uncharacterized protein YbjT (DUF2867 family)